MGLKLPFCNSGKPLPLPGKLLCSTAGKLSLWFCNLHQQHCGPVFLSRGYFSKGLNGFMTLMDAQSQFKSTQLCKWNAGTSLIRGESAHARAEGGTCKDAADNGGLRGWLQLWACRFGEIGTPPTSRQSLSLCGRSSWPGLPRLHYKQNV